MPGLPQQQQRWDQHMLDDVSDSRAVLQQPPHGRDRRSFVTLTQRVVHVGGLTCQPGLAWWRRARWLSAFRGRPLQRRPIDQVLAVDQSS